jgi:hypothetical protein
LCVGLAGFSLSSCSHNKVMSSSESLASLVPCHWLSVGHLLRKKCKGVVWTFISFLLKSLTPFLQSDQQLGLHECLSCDETLFVGALPLVKHLTSFMREALYLVFISWQLPGCKVILISVTYFHLCILQLLRNFHLNWWKQPGLIVNWLLFPSELPSYLIVV